MAQTQILAPLKAPGRPWPEIWPRESPPLHWPSRQQFSRSRCCSGTECPYFWRFLLSRLDPPPLEHLVLLPWRRSRSQPARNFSMPTHPERTYSARSPDTRADLSTQCHSFARLNCGILSAPPMKLHWSRLVCPCPGISGTGRRFPFSQLCALGFWPFAWAF